MNSLTKIVLFIVLLIILFSCNATKYVSEENYLLEKNVVTVNGKKESSPDILSYLQQRPNQRVLGVPISLHIYNLGNPDTLKTIWPDKNPKFRKWLSKNFSEKQALGLSLTSKKINNWLLKSGNAPVISKINKIEKSTKALQQYYINNGFWNATANYKENKKKNQRIEVNYNIETGKAYFADTINYNIETSILDSLYKKHIDKSYIKPNEQYRVENFEKENDRLISLYRNSGIYKFGNNSIRFMIDDTTSIKNYKYNVLLNIPNRYQNINDSIVKVPYKVQKVTKVNVFTDYDYATKGLSYKDSASYKNINFFAAEKLKYNPKYLSNAIVIQPNGIYKDSERDLTRKYLRDLENFKASIDIKYDENKDESLTANIYLSPLKKFGLTWDLDLTTSNIKPFGILGKFGFLNRNVFKGAEIFELSFQGSFVNTAIDVSNNDYFLNLNALEIGTTASLKIPRIFFPFNTSKIIPKTMTPKTNISFSLGVQKNIGLDRQNITGSLDYTWQSSKTSNHKFELLNIQYINNRNAENYFGVYKSEYNKLTTISDGNPASVELTVIPVPNEIRSEFYTQNINGSKSLIASKYINYILDPRNNFASTNPAEYNYIKNVEEQRKILVEDALVPTMSYTYNYNNRENAKDNSFSTFTGRLISAGNVTTSLIKKKNEKGEKVLFDLPVKQYVKTEVEYKKYWEINRNRTLVFRSFIGAAIPFGNSKSIPFSRSYRAGGSNDIRAWRTFDLGLGSENSTLEFNVGSLKLTTNLEYRFKLINSLNAAVFIDAGNIWDISKTNLSSSKEKFRGFNSIKDIAIGSGVGARYDFGFLIFRLDLGFKTYEPYLNSSSKWFRNYNFANNTLNFGINYPF